MKTCTKCREQKSLDLYSKNKSTSDGLQQQCKACNAAHYKLNAEKVLARIAATYAADSTKTKERAAKWYSDNTERARAAQAKWAAANRDVKAKSNDAWAKKNPEKLKEMRRKSYLKNPERQNSGTRAYRARKRGAEGSHTVGDILQLMQIQKSRCAACATDISQKYHVDHVMPLALGGSNDKSNLQLLCQSCNTSKGAKHPADFMRKRGFLL